jgi:glyoxylase-like metal-dependent hydrolase (beta-lactamase superfamily II)
VKSKKSRVAIVLLVLLVPAYWWFLIESGTPQGTYDLDLTELRRLADSMPGEKPSAIRLEEVLEFEFPKVAVLAGSGWSNVKMPVFSYQLVFSDRFIIVDTAMDQATAKDAARFEPEAFARVTKAMESAALIVVTHEHSDHLGGLATHPKLAQLSFAVTDDQLSDPKKLAPVVFPSTNRKPFTYERSVAIAPGVVLWKAPGHTPGSQMVFVKLQNGEEFLLLGDIAWHATNYKEVRERARLVTALFLGEDREAVLRQLAAIKALAAAEPKLHVVPGHDGDVMKQLIEAGSMTARFAP